jgi:Fe-S-cluster containining protein
MDTEFLIQDWRKRGPQQKAVFKKYLAKLQRQKSRGLAEQAQIVHAEVFEKIDCLACANCCSSIPPIVTKSDAARISKHLGMRQAEFEQQYLHLDEDGDLVMRHTPCPFLGKDNYCSIYEERPKACREYPHTDYYEFNNNLQLHAENARWCPAVFHILERMMQGFEA